MYRLNIWLLGVTLGVTGIAGTTDTLAEVPAGQETEVAPPCGVRARPPTVLGNTLTGLGGMRCRTVPESMRFTVQIYLWDDDRWIEWRDAPVQTDPVIQKVLRDVDGCPDGSERWVTAATLTATSDGVTRTYADYSPVVTLQCG